MQISFVEYVAECLSHCQDGLIMESEMAAKIASAAKGETVFVDPPTNDTEELGLNS
jgi:hypothetical protein